MSGSSFGRNYGCIDAPKLPIREHKVRLVRASAGPSEIHCTDCGAMLMPMVLGSQFDDAAGRGAFKVDVWACWTCSKLVEVRFADWMPQTGAHEDA
jgi:hypothetical protein